MLTVDWDRGRWECGIKLDQVIQVFHENILIFANFIQFSI